MDCKGNAFSETLLTLVILFTITSTLVPASNAMYTTLSNKQMDLHASETALEAAKIILNEGQNNGIKQIDNITYSWNYDGNRICVEYNYLNEVRSKCISRNGG